MDKRAIVAIALSILVFVAWTWLFAPRPAPPPLIPDGSTVPVADKSPAAGPSAPDGGALDQPQIAGERDKIAAAAAPLEDERRMASPAVARPSRREAPEGAPPAVIETEFARIEIARQGARLVSWRLKQHQDSEGRPYELVSPESDRFRIYPFQLRLEDKPLEALLNERARFDLEVEGPGLAGGSSAAATTAPSPSAAAASTPASTEKPGSAAPSPGLTSRAAASSSAGGPPPDQVFRLIYSDGLGVVAVKTFSVRKDSYLIEVEASVTRGGKPIKGEIVWGPGIGNPSDEDRKNRYYYGGQAIADYGLGRKRFYPGKLVATTTLDEGALWVGLEEQYFATVFIPLNAAGAKGIQIFPAIASSPPASGSTAPAGAKASEAKPALCVAVPMDEPYALFAGPKDYQLLGKLGRGLPELVSFNSGTPLIGPLIGALAKGLWAALRWLYAFIPNYGLGIIILTTAIKIIFYPITQRAMVKMRGEQKKMQKVQPKVTAIKDKFKKVKDAAGRAKMNEEIMALYKREGINPMASLGGCLPLLLQLPVLWAFYSVLTVSIELRHAPFFWWIQDLSRKDPYYITPILMGISMFAQQRLAMTKVTDPQQRAQQNMMLVMPLIFVVTFVNMPSGLVVYWFVNNLLGIAQQVLINRQALALEARERAAAIG